MERCISCDATYEDPTWQCPACGFSPRHSNSFRCFAPELSAANQDYDPRHFKVLAELEAGSFWFRSRNELITWALRRFFSNANNIFEVGVGTGFVLDAIRRAFPDATLSGSDIHTEALEFASERLGRTGSVRLMQMDARRIPFWGHFDVVCAFDVIEHIREDDLVLRELYLALRSRGGLLLTVPQHKFLWGPADDAAFHVRRYATNELKRKVEAAGFEVLFKTSFVSLLLPALWLSRLRSKKAGCYDLASELKLPIALDQLFFGVCEVEQVLIKAGLPLPFGGSQLLVASRRD